MDPKVMEELRKKFKSLNLKKKEPVIRQNKNIGVIQKDNRINQQNIKKEMVSYKDKIGLFEKKNNEKPQTINNFVKDKKETPKINNNNNIINSTNKLIKEQTKQTKQTKNKIQCKSLVNNKIINNDLILQKESPKMFKSVTNAFLKKDKINIDNFQIKKTNDKDKENIIDEEIVKINDYKQKIIDNTSPKEKEKQKQKKKFSLIDENNKLTIKIKSKKIYKKEDFEILNFLGKGAYGTVLQARLFNDPEKKIYAIKKLDIFSLLSCNRLYQAYLENEILSEIDCPYIVKVYGSFEADEKIHIIMDYMPKGDLAYFIKANYPLRPDLIKFYAAEMVSFFEYMQKKNLIHRDLKPQNIMIDDKGHLKVIDFGTVRKKGFYFDKKEMKFKEENSFQIIDYEDIKGVKSVVNPDADEEDSEEEEEDDNEDNNIKNKNIKTRTQRSMTFVGTAEYISPEVIADKPAEFGTDIWAFGVMLYQMIFNTTPFKDQSAYLTFRKIESAKVKYPTDSNNISDEAKDLLNKIFVVDPNKRLGGGNMGTQNDINHLKMHKYFKGIKWDNLKNMSPPGFNNYKFYESKRKSIYKKIENNSNNNINDGYKIFDDKSNTNDIKIIKEGYINKQSFWFHYVKRYISLDTTPRIVVTNMDENGDKKVISLNKKCRVSIVKDNCFELRTPEKNHKFKGLSNDGNDWAGIINDVINEYGVD